MTFCKRALLGISFLCLMACGMLTIALAVAGLGIAGAGVTSYCAIESCPLPLTAYAELITTQATEDAVILESGATTAAQVAGVLANLQMALAAGQTLPGLTAAQQKMVVGIVTVLNEVIPLIEALEKQSPPATLSAKSGKGAAVVTLPPLTTREVSAIATMRTKITTARLKYSSAHPAL